MARRPKLNDQQKAHAIYLLEQGKRQSQVAAFFGVSDRTIYRLREEVGYTGSLLSLTDHQRDILKVVQNAGLNARQLKERLSTQPLTAAAVVETIADLNPADLGHFLVNTIKVHIAQEAEANQQAHARVHTGEMTQEALYG